MASTRNRNTPGDYALEQRSNTLNHDYMSYDKSAFYGTVGNTYLPGNGLVGMKTAGMNLSANAADIESQLFGIGSTNLVSPQRPIAPDVYQLKSLNIADRTPLILSDKFSPAPNQRPMPLN